MAPASDSGERLKISDRTDVKLGLVLGCLGFLFGGIWWAATMQSKVDSILTVLQEMASMRAKAEDHEKRIWKLELMEKRP